MLFVLHKNSEPEPHIPRSLFISFSLWGLIAVTYHEPHDHTRASDWIEVGFISRLVAIQHGGVALVLSVNEALA